MSPVWITLGMIAFVGAIVGAGVLIAAGMELVHRLAQAQGYR